MTDLREKVARAIIKAFDDGSPELARDMKMDASAWMDEADAAIKAMLDALKEPSGEMLQAGNRVWLDGGNERQIFQAMLTTFTCDHYLSALAEEDGKVLDTKHDRMQP